MTTGTGRNIDAMELFVEKRLVKRMTNIDDKVLEEVYEYRVYRKVLWGLVRAYIRITPPYYLDDVSIFAIEYTSLREEATVFKRESDAHCLVNEVILNPDKFLRIQTYK